MIDFVGKLFNLSLPYAVRKLNDDFSLGLPLTAPITEQEQLQAKVEADRRQFIRQSEQEFEEWKDRLLRRLSLCLRIADDAAETDPDDLYEEEALAMRWAPFFTDTWESLVYGAIEQQMKVFCDRKEVDKLCSRVLKLTLTRFMQS